MGIRRLKCIFININSIVSNYKKHILQTMIDDNRPDVFFLVEHKLTPKHNFELKGYRTHRQNRTNGKGGGKAICLCEDIKEKGSRRILMLINPLTSILFIVL